jgi:hypothetical protein
MRLKQGFIQMVEMSIVVAQIYPITLGSSNRHRDG